MTESSKRERRVAKAPASRWSPRAVAGALAGLAWLTLTACSSSGGNGLECGCPNAAFNVSVPASRASDVESVTATGACSHAQPLDGTDYSVWEDNVGTCHIRVTFTSGAPEFDTDVELARGTYECETVCAPTPTSSVPIAVPELDGAGGASDEPRQKG